VGPREDGMVPTRGPPQNRHDGAAYIPCRGGRRMGSSGSIARMSASMRVGCVGPPSSRYAFSTNHVATRHPGSAGSRGGFRRPPRCTHPSAKTPPPTRTSNIGTTTHPSASCHNPICWPRRVDPSGRLRRRETVVAAALAGFRARDAREVRREVVRAAGTTERRRGWCAFRGVVRGPLRLSDRRRRT